MADSKFDEFLEEKEVKSSPTKYKVEALEELKDNDAERAEEIIQEGLESDVYTEKEVAGVVEIKQGNKRGEKALKQLLNEKYPAYEYEVGGKSYSARDPTHRRNVVKHLSRHGEDIIDEMRSVLKEDKDSFTLEIAIRSLAASPTDRDKELLEQLLERNVNEKTKEKAREKIQSMKED